MAQYTILTENGDIADPFQSFIAKSKYAKWIPEKNRRETWTETVDRYMKYWDDNPNVEVPNDLRSEVRENILHHETMPSMRLLMTAGAAVERSGVAAYNCSFVAIDSPRTFDESLFILMNGTGLGFSAEEKFVSQLPVVPKTIEAVKDTIVVEDSKEGWAAAYRELIEAMYNGYLPRWDLRKLRPEGARLKTFGGRSSGPAPLNELFEFTVEKFAAMRGRRLSSLACHEIMCKIGMVVVVGGVRRSALMSLGDLDDESMRDAKKGAFWETKPHLSLSNNSAVYDSKPTREVFDAEWNALVASGSGERGIFNRQGAIKNSPERRDAEKIVGTNPCAEILLRSKGFCNLSEVVVRADDTLEDLIRKVSVATVIGTWQSTITNFEYLRQEWIDNQVEERLLGVSLTGEMSHSVLNGTEGFEKMRQWLNTLRDVAVETNRVEAERIGINQSTSVTTVKPSGTVSLLVGSSSGIHPYYDKRYLRTARGSNSDPLTQYLKFMNIPNELNAMDPTSTVFTFALEAPEGAKFNDDFTAIESLEIWRAYKQDWAEHSVSVTINVRNHEWEEVGNWVFDNFDDITGVSFLPADDNVYLQAPIQKTDIETWNSVASTLPDEMDWSGLELFEQEDSTTGTQELACTAGVCEVSDFVK